jgi:hypothetical protein
VVLELPDRRPVHQHTDRIRRRIIIVS